MGAQGLMGAQGRGDVVLGSASHRRRAPMRWSPLFCHRLALQDVSLPTALFDRLAVAAPELFGMSAKTKRPHLKVRSWLTALKKLSLLMGNVSSGWHMHDIVRDFAISRCKDLRALHRSIVNAVLAARPEEGWMGRDSVSRGTAEWFVAIHLSHNVRGAIGGEVGEDGARFVHRVLAAVKFDGNRLQAPVALAEACTLAIGFEPMVGLAKTARAGGEPLRAARAWYAASVLSRHGLRPLQEEVELLTPAYQALQAELEDDAEANAMELTVLMRVMMRGSLSQNGGQRMLQLQERDSEAQSKEEMSVQQSLSASSKHWFAFMSALGMFGMGEPNMPWPTVAQFEAAALPLCDVFRMYRTLVEQHRGTDWEIPLLSCLFGGLCMIGSSAAFRVFVDAGEVCCGTMDDFRQIVDAYDFAKHHAKSVELATLDGVSSGAFHILPLHAWGHVGEVYYALQQKSLPALEQVIEDSGFDGFKVTSPCCVLPRRSGRLAPSPYSIVVSLGHASAHSSLGHALALLIVASLCVHLFSVCVPSCASDLEFLHSNVDEYRPHAHERRGGLSRIANAGDRLHR